jgi:hypothetical protein
MRGIDWLRTPLLISVVIQFEGLHFATIFQANFQFDDFGVSMRPVQTGQELNTAIRKSLACLVLYCVFCAVVKFPENIIF